MSQNIIEWDLRSPIDGMEAIFTVELNAVLAHLELDGVFLSVVTVGDLEMRNLNAKWRNKDAATDVLSFPQIMSADELLSGAMLGDIVISTDTAKVQAHDHGHPVAAEYRVLLVHGLCHLLGYTHDDLEDRKEMADLENRLLCVMTGGETQSTIGLVRRAQGEENV